MEVIATFLFISAYTCVVIFISYNFGFKKGQIQMREKIALLVEDESNEPDTYAFGNDIRNTALISPIEIFDSKKKIVIYLLLAITIRKLIFTHSFHILKRQLPQEKTKCCKTKSMFPRLSL